MDDLEMRRTYEKLKKKHIGAYIHEICEELKEKGINKEEINDWIKKEMQKGNFYKLGDCIFEI